MRRLRSLYVDPSSGGKLPGIQGVRALAAAAIVAFHVWVLSAPDGGRFDVGVLSSHLLPHLALGVSLLFVLSAFLLYRPFAAAVMRARPSPSLLGYLVNRALRILPAYWAILLFTSFVLEMTVVRRADSSMAIAPLDDPALLLVNALFLQSLHPSTLLSGIGPVWALTAVVTFYVLLPVLVLIAVWCAKFAPGRRGRRIAALVPAAILFVGGIATKVVLASAPRSVYSSGWGPDWGSVLERSFFAHGDFFALGLVVAVIRVDWEDGLLGMPRWWRAAAVAAMLFIAVPTAKWTQSEAFSVGSASNYAYDTLMSFVCALFLALVVIGDGVERGSLVRVLESPLVFAVGLVSYGLFLWHVPVLLWLREHGFTFGTPLGFAANLASVGVASLALSTLTYRYFEFPALKRKIGVGRGRQREAAAVKQAEAAP